MIFILFGEAGLPFPSLLVTSFCTFFTCELLRKPVLLFQLRYVVISAISVWFLKYFSGLFLPLLRLEAKMTSGDLKFLLYSGLPPPLS